MTRTQIVATSRHAVYLGCFGISFIAHFDFRGSGTASPDKSLQEKNIQFVINIPNAGVTSVSERLRTEENFSSLKDVRIRGTILFLLLYE